MPGLEVSQGTKFREQMLVLTVLLNFFFWSLYLPQITSTVGLFLFK